MSKNYFDILPAGKIFTLLLILTFNNAIGQTLTGPATVNNYSIAQKRLLATSIFEYSNFLTQHNLDQDSIMEIACHITSMPFLLPYSETFPEIRNVATTDLLNTGHLEEAKKSLTNMSGELRVQALVEIFLWYLHQKGTAKNDLDSASRFLQLAAAESNNVGSERWKGVCLFQSAELAYQKAEKQQSRKLFNGLVKSGVPQGNTQLKALALIRIGDLLSPTDTTKEHYYYQALKIFQALQLVEKQIEIFWKIALCHEHKDFLLAEKDLREIIKLSNQTGFKHIFYAQTHLSYVLSNNGNNLGAMDYAKVALENVKWSGFNILETTCYIRMGIAYSGFGELEESLKWLRMAINKGTKENHIFWYRGIMFLTALVGFQMNKPAMALYLIDSITTKFPPITAWEKLQLTSSIGTCYELLNKPILAEKFLNQLLILAKAYPQADPYGEMFGDYVTIAQFYVSRNHIATARQFLKLAMAKERKSAEALYLLYSLYYKMDSLEGNYKSALQNHINYKIHFDSSISIVQRKQMDELNVKYAAEKKDKDIGLLRQQRVVQQTEIKKNKLVRDIMIAGTAMLLIIVALLFNRYKLKQRANRAINLKNLALHRVINEKEWLLKEVHHRVKNNLHTIISLLESQAAYLENDALKAIENSQHRIYAMSLIHQKLYQADSVKTIDMSVYLPEFIRYLDESFEIHYRIQFNLDIEAINLGVSQAIPVALIINEAVTNSIKYAFPNNSKGRIKITMHRKANQVTLVIADSGIGFNEALLNQPSETLGLKLMKGLSGDIDSSIAIEIENGTKITLVFEVDRFVVNKTLSDDINHIHLYV